MCVCVRVCVCVCVCVFNRVEKSLLEKEKMLVTGNFSCQTWFSHGLFMKRGILYKMVNYFHVFISVSLSAVLTQDATIPDDFFFAS